MPPKGIEGRDTMAVMSLLFISGARVWLMLLSVAVQSEGNTSTSWGVGMEEERERERGSLFTVGHAAKPPCWEEKDLSPTDAGAPPPERIEAIVGAWKLGRQHDQAEPSSPPPGVFIILGVPADMRPSKALKQSRAFRIEGVEAWCRPPPRRLVASPPVELFIEAEKRC